MDIVYGTGNSAKVENMRKIINEEKFDIKLEMLKDIGFDEEIVEDGDSFEQNSEIKARAIEKYCKNKGITNKIIITDDAGLCVDKLNGEPGIYTARYAGEHPSQIENLNKLLGKMKDFNDLKDRTATFVCVLTAIDLASGEKIVTKGECKGIIAKEYKKLGGLTYAPVFIPEGFDVPMLEIDDSKDAYVYKHRYIAMKEMINEFKKRSFLG